MGGGGVMRAVAKVAGIGISSTGGLRGVPSFPAGENVVSAAARKSSRPVAAIVSSHDGEAVDHVQRPSWELEDWEFYGFDDELTTLKPKPASSDPLPRLVFGGAPTIEKAKEATLDLKDALEKVYLQSPTASAKTEDSISINQDFNQLEKLSNSGFSDTNICVTAHDDIVPYAVQAFKYLHQNPAAQTVVSSIASDPNVWNAVMQNEELTKFLKSQHTTVSPSDTFTDDNNSVVDRDLKENEIFGASFSRFVDNLKCQVVDMVVGNLSDFIQKTFGGFTDEKKSKDGDDSFIDTTILGSSFMGLAVFVILLVVLKRG